MHASGSYSSATSLKFDLASVEHVAELAELRSVLDDRVDARAVGVLHRHCRPPGRDADAEALVGERVDRQPGVVRLLERDRGGLHCRRTRPRCHSRRARAQRPASARPSARIDLDDFIFRPPPPQKRRSSSLGSGHGRVLSLDRGTAGFENKRRRADSNRCTRLCRPLPNHSATAPPGHRSEGVTASPPAPLYLRQLNTGGPNVHRWRSTHPHRRHPAARLALLRRRF